MSERLVLVDSSAWIRYLSDRGSAYAHSIGKLLADHRVAINPVIRVEVLTGAKDESQYAQLEDAFGGLHALDLTDSIWRRAERLRFELRRAGHWVPVPDTIIACCSIVYNCELLHADRHFDRIAKSVALKICQPV